MAPLLVWLCFLPLVYLSAACQESWVLDTKNQDTPRTVAFKNVTTPGKIQLLTWTWSGSKYENWQCKVVHHYTDGLIEGFLTYRKTAHTEKKIILLQWRLIGNDFSSIKSNQKIFSNSWSIYTCDGISLDFNSNKEGNWEFTVFNNYTITNNPEAEEKNQKEIPENVLRKRRSADETEMGPTNQGDNATIQQAGVIGSIYDFFFGTGDPAEGRGEGIFVRIKNWVKGMFDRMRKDGGSTAPTTVTIPPCCTVTIPPATINPDAEEVTNLPPSAISEEVTNLPPSTISNDVRKK